MGDPRKHRRKYIKPSHPWEKERLDAEREITNEYGLKNKKELYKLTTFLKNIKSNIKKVTSNPSTQAKKEKDQLIARLKKLNLLGETADVDTVLGLKLKDIMDRRLQSVVLKKGLANTVKQARQFITHHHIVVKDQKISSPNYLVSGEEESTVSFYPNSSISNPDHPERIAAIRDIKKEVEKIKPKKEEPIDEDLAAPEIEELPEEADAKEIEKAVSEEESKKEEK